MEKNKIRNGKDSRLNGKTSDLTKSCSIIFLNIFKTCASTLLHRFNFRKTIVEIKTLGKKYGPYFLIYAVCVEVFEDLVLPFILYSIGKSELIPVVLALHSEPVMYPFFFAISSILKKIRQQRKFSGIV
jgi:hypothetical protein